MIEMQETSSNVNSPDVLEIQKQNQLAQREAARIQREFEQASADKAMQFEADQAKLNRDWQTSANRTAMEFEADQAELNRMWQEGSNSRAMAFEAEQAELNRAYYERLSNTAYQRSMQDMKAAGLNPILAAGGSGASAAMGSTASGFSSGGSTASGFTSSGSMASGYKATGSKASVDTSSSVEVMKAVLSSASSALNALSSLSFEFKTGLNNSSHYSAFNPFSDSFAAVKGLYSSAIKALSSSVKLLP